MNAIEQLKAVLCDQAGRCCISGSDEDRAIVDRALQALAQPQPQPLGVFREDDDIGHVELCPYQQAKLQDGDKLYTSPQAQPLSDEFLRKMHHEDQFGLFCDYDDFEQIVRAIEQAHGITKGKT